MPTIFTVPMSEALDDDTLSIVIETAAKSETDLITSLRFLVRQGAEGSKFERLKGDSKSSNLSDLTEKLRAIDKLTDEVILKLQRASL